MDSIEKYKWFRGLLGIPKESTIEQIKSTIDKRVNELVKNKNIAAADELKDEIKSTDRIPEDPRAEIKNTGSVSHENTSAANQPKVESTEPVSFKPSETSADNHTVQMSQENTATPNEPKVESTEPVSFQQSETPKDGDTVQVSHDFKEQLKKEIDSHKGQQTLGLTKSLQK
jgi:hypothetical protein